MMEDSLGNRKYTYIHESKWPHEATDLHHIVVRRSSAKRILMRICVPLVLASSLFLVLLKSESIMLLLWSLILSGLIVQMMLRKPIEKESVIIMPALGVQLETHYVSGRVVRQFFPFGKILKPVLLECVTPVTCYWSLSLVVRDEEELTLVFKKLHPPVKMLVPIWKALCANIDDKETPNVECGL